MVQDRILIKVAEEETSSSGGVILTSQSSEKPTIGEVIAVGPGKKGDKDKLTPVSCKPGEQVRR
jgi:chaperonin GroES